MAPSADSWTGGSFPLSSYLDDVDPAVDIANIISDKSTSITVIRSGAAQAAQTVRLELLRGDRQVQTPAGITVSVDAVVFGYQGHATLTDTDLQVKDRFRSGGFDYEIVAILPATVDGLQAYAKVRD